MRVCTGTNDCSRVRVRGRGRGRGRARARGRGRGRDSDRYAAVCGLRHLLHGLTVVGVAAAYNAGLQLRQAHLVDEFPELRTALGNAEDNQATTFTTLAQLRAQLDALQPGEQTAEAKSLRRSIDDAKVLYDMAAAKVISCQRFVDENRKELEHVRSEILAMQGALLA